MRLPALLLVTLLGLASAPRALAVGETCGTVSPDSRYECCVDKAASDESDEWCTTAYPELYENNDPPGSSCGSVNPENDGQYTCCVDKVASGDEDDFCSTTYPELYAPPGSSCASYPPDDQYECCQTAVKEDKEDDHCKQLFPSLYNPLGSSCASVSPTDNGQENCCVDKVANDEDDKWCRRTYPQLYEPNPPVGSSCGSYPPENQLDCCHDKVASDEEDEYCKTTYPELYDPPGSSCASYPPPDQYGCCADKVAKSEDDTFCKDHFPELYPSGDDNTKDYPYLSVVKGPFQDCGGSLVAPGYVLTAAQCVFKDGKAAEAAEVTVWVGGKWHDVVEVHVNQDNANFDGFQQPNSEMSWDVAMLALNDTSDAAYVALPTSDVPALGDWVDQTAWKDQTSVVETAKINVWDGCSPDALWADDFCGGGAGFLQTCPGDKGSPMLAGNTQVGLTSGDGCDGTASNWGAFLKLSDKKILEQITVWLNSREGTDNTGLDDNVRAWLQEANTYLYGRK